MNENMSSAVPVIIISGYLGAGKTTLISEFLSDPSGLRAIILVNDFGRINLDAELIAQQGGDTIALTNGCACCTIGDDLLSAADRAMDQNPDVLIVEASGVAQPARILNLLQGIAGALPAKILTVVNGSASNSLSQDKFVAGLYKLQIEQSDRLSINRLDENAKVPELLQHKSRCDQLGEFIRQEGDIKGPTSPIDITIKHDFEQMLCEPQPMQELAVRDWLDQLHPNLQRAKGTIPVISANGCIRMARLEYAQGDFSLIVHDETEVTDKGRVVAIGIANMEHK